MHMNASRILTILRSPSRPSSARRQGFSLSCVSTAAVIAVVACVCSVRSSDAQCIDYGDYLHWAGALDTSTDAVAVSGSHAYLADGFSNFKVVDITDPSTPQIVGSVVTAGLARDIALSGNYAYIAAVNNNVGGFRGLQVIDIASPES